MVIQASAPAKVILSGEHGVVYGKPALVAGFNLRLTCTIAAGQQTRINSKFWQDIQLVENMVKKYLEKRGMPCKKDEYTLTITSDIPIGRGLGSSAAFAVAAVAALYTFYAQQPTPDTVNNIAYTIEKHFHGAPSGADNSAATFGGLIFYRKEFEFLKQISALNFKLPAVIEKSLYLIDSGKPTESTREMIAAVGRFYNHKSQEAENLFNQMEKQTKRMVVAIVKEDPVFFREAIAENHALLTQIGVVSDKTNQLLASLKPFGVGKVTGAGGKTSGSGFIIFATTDPDRLEKYLKRHALSFYKFSQATHGLQISV